MQNYFMFKNSTFRRFIDNNSKERIHINRCNVEIADTYKYLGIKFNDHINYIIPNFI